MTGRTFTTPEVCALTGITFRQADYWARTNLVRPSIAEAEGSGRHRVYSATDVAVLRVLRRALDGPARSNNLATLRAIEPAVRSVVERGVADAVLVFTAAGSQVHGAVFVLTGFDLPNVEAPIHERDDAPAHDDRGDVNTNAAVTSCVAAGL